MKNTLFLLIIMLLVCACSGPYIKSTLEEEKLIERSRRGYEIEAFDYDPERNRIYYIEVNSHVPPWKSTPAKPQAILSRFDLDTKERVEIYSAFTTSAAQSEWLQLTQKGTLLVHDSGIYDPGNIKTRPPQLLEFKDDKVINRIPVINALLLKKAALPGTFKDYKEQKKAGAAKLLEQSGYYKPIGYYMANKVRFSPQPGPAAPKFLVIESGGKEAALDIFDCTGELFLRYAAKFSGNPAAYNPSARGAASAEKFIVSAKENIYVQHYNKGPGYYNFPCEKYFKVLVWGEEKLKLESCARGFIEFPASMYVLTKNQKILYRRLRGIFAALKKNRGI